MTPKYFCQQKTTAPSGTVTITYLSYADDKVTTVDWTKAAFFPSKVGGQDLINACILEKIKDVYARRLDKYNFPLKIDFELVLIEGGSFREAVMTVKANTKVSFTVDENGMWSYTVASESAS